MKAAISGALLGISDGPDGIFVVVLQFADLVGDFAGGLGAAAAAFEHEEDHVQLGERTSFNWLFSFCIASSIGPANSIFVALIVSMPSYCCANWQAKDSYLSATASRVSTAASQSPYRIACSTL